MNKQQFLRERRPAWSRFETLLSKMGTPTRPRLEADEVSEFSDLFRGLCYDLAQVRSRDWGLSIERYLNDLVIRGHSAFYGGKTRRRGSILRFFSHSFPRLLRENAAFFWLASAVFYIPMAISWVVVQTEPSMAGRILPGTTLYGMEQMYADDISNMDERREDAAMAGMYVRHNTSIAFQSFALGIFAGFGTVYVLLSNGIILGTVAGFIIGRGHGENFLSFVVSHGSFELTAIVVSGMAGLILGHALIAPGTATRLEALRVRGMVAVKLTLGAAGLMFIAALIEGFWSASPVPPMAKYVAAVVLWSSVFAYLGLAGRGDSSELA